MSYARRPHGAMKILLVEDDAVTRRLLERLLRARGHEVTACNDAESAWEAYQRDRHTLVILDWVLPGMDGLQLCRNIRALRDGDRSLIVLLTARDQPQDLQAVLDAGADDYLTKAVDVPRLNVRLGIAERQATALIQRKAAEDQLADIMGQLRSSRDDMLSILNQLRIGTLITDDNGRVTFLSETCERLLATGMAAAIGQQWQALCPLAERDERKLAAMCAATPSERSRIALRLASPDGRHYWVETEVKDDPRDPQRKIFFFYDVTEIHDLRRRRTEKARFGELIGKSDGMALVFEQIRELAAV